MSWRQSLTTANAERRIFPWDETMAFALGVLRLSPSEFWAMTPRELALAMSPWTAGSAAPARDEFDRLMRRFPDTEETSP